ncbi:MAG: flagellar basal body rod protein FlgB [Steroidobacteraceae bacterium]
MPANLDSYLGVHAAALQVRSRRTELLATNLANADTPGYQARDIDFRKALAHAATQSPSAVTMQATHAGHLQTAKATEADADLLYRTPLAPSIDGNTVDVQLEQAAFAENAVRYQATLSFLSSKFRGLMTAITGQ